MNKTDISDSDKIEMVDKIINVLPGIKKKRSYIINKIIPAKNIPADDYVLEKIKVNDKYYYRDKYKCILNEEAELVGVWNWNINKHDFDYYIFADEKGKILQ